MLTDEEIIRANPWWRGQGWEAGDPHLQRLAGQPARLPAPEVDAIDLITPSLHIVRGPRQVGKSTDLKLIVQRSLREGRRPESILYLALDLLEGQPFPELVRTVRRAGQLASVLSWGLLLLDEVTTVPRWRLALKALWDEGAIDRSVTICTGSSAVDLARAESESLAGRRGEGVDWLVLPQDLGAFARAVVRSLPAPPGLDVEEITSADGQLLMLDMHRHLPDLRLALERYLRFGGLPAAVAEASRGLAGPSEATRRVLHDSLLLEIRRKGASVPAADALLERLMRSLGSRVSWQRMAEEMTVPLGGKRARHTTATDRRTLQDYIQLLATGYFALVVYCWRQDSGTADLSKDKKVYFGDPLLHTITADRVGLAPNPHAQVENALAVHLFRRYEPQERQPGTFAAPDRLHVWGTKTGGEIDFVCGPRSAIHAVEVADWERLNRQKATGPMRALPGRPSLVATKDHLEFSTSMNLVPAALVLWALSGRQARA
ncbi:MAG: ATP-binding protein [Candidatus Dormibacteria bacterium]